MTNAKRQTTITSRQQTTEQDTEAGPVPDASFIGIQTEREAWRPTVAVDFDGVIRDCRERPGDPWRPLAGAASGLRRLKTMGYRIVVFSSRDEHAIRPFMERHRLPYDEIRGGKHHKPLFTALIDDRAIRFDGNWAKATQELGRFKPYWRA